MTDAPAPTPPPLPDDGPQLLPLPQPEDQEAVVDDAHRYRAALFGAAPPGPIDPVPVVSIGGVDVASTPGYTVPVALDGLSVNWGRSEALGQPTPATASLRLFDSTGTWATTRDLIGQLLTLSWVAGGVRRPFFIGRLTSANIERRSVLNAADGSSRAGAVVSLSAASLLNDLANRVPFEDWPLETVGARLGRLLGYSGNVLTGGATLRAYWRDPQVAPVAAADQPSILDSLMALYASTGTDRFTFLPANQSARNVQRRDTSNRSAGLTELWWNVAGEGTARDGRGAYVRSQPIHWENVDPAALTGLPHYLDAGWCEDIDGVRRDIGARVTRVEVEHPDLAATPAYAHRVELVLTSSVPGATGVDEGTTGVRTAHLDSSICWNNYCATAASDLAGMAAGEGAGWRVERIVYRGDRFGGFEYFDQVADLMLAGGETQATVFLENSYLPLMGIRPVFSVIGGTISYQGGWVCSVNVMPTNTGLKPQHQISWEEIDDGSATYQLEWHDDDHPRGLHPSLTFDDMAFVNRGLGVTSRDLTGDWDSIQ